MTKRNDNQPASQSQALVQFFHRTAELRIQWHVERAARDAAVSAAARRVAA